MENESCLNRIIAKSESQNATVTERKIALYIKENLEKVLHCNLLELAELIRRIRDTMGCTILLVEHDMGLVMNICQTVCAISFGKLLAIGTPEEIQKDPQVQKAYLGESDEEVEK